MTKISNLPQDSTPSSDDFTITVDTTSGQAKKVSLADLGTYLGVRANNFSNPYKFHAYSTATQNLAGSATKLAFETEFFDTNSNYDTTLSRYTAPLAGFYVFNAQGYINALSSGSEVVISLYKNGSQHTNFTVTSAGANDYRPHVTHMLQLSANDYIEIYVSNTQGTRNWYGLTALGYYASYFQGFLLSTT